MTEFSNYRDISARLKKRFSLRKPNYLEAADSFKKLSTKLNDFKEYSGFCLYSAAQCHHNNVVLLQEQKAKSNTGINLLLPNNSRTTVSQSLLETPVQHGISLSTSHNISFIDLGRNRILDVAQQKECQAWLDTAVELCLANEINGAIAAYWHASQTCSQSQLPMIYFQWAKMLQNQGMYLEAVDIYLEACMFHEAIECLLSGQYFQDAYDCYQELITSLKMPSKPPSYVSKKRPAFSSFPPSTSSSSSTNSNMSSEKPTNSKTTNVFANLFMKKTPSEETLQRKDEEKIKNNENIDRNFNSSSSNIKCERNPFLYKPSLSVDDHVNIFLLKLYLYDPVNYEYPSPIVPLPQEIKNGNARNDSEEDVDEIVHINQAQHDDLSNYEDKPVELCLKVDRLNLETDSLQVDSLTSLHRFVNMNNSSKFVRTKADLIEMNMLFETLFSSLKNELKHTVDHDHRSNVSFHEQRIERCEIDSENKDKNDLEEMLRKAVLDRKKFDKLSSQDYRNSERMFESFTNSIEANLNKLDDEQSLRLSIKEKLFHLLNSHQNQILSLILDR